MDVGAEKLNGGQQDGRRLLPTEATRGPREMPMSSSGHPTADDDNDDEYCKYVSNCSSLNYFAYSGIMQRDSR